MVTMNKIPLLFWNIITLLGGSYVYVPLMIIVLLTKNYPFFLDLMMGFLLTLALTVIIRSFYFKERPQKMLHHNWFQKINASSFPSWHASRSVFLTLLFYSYFPKGIILLVLSFLTILVFYSRIYLKKHDWNDITGGVF